MRNLFFNEREITVFRHSSAQRRCAKHNPERSEGLVLSYQSLWVPIISMRGKFPIGTYNLNGFLQVSMLHLFKASPCPLRFASGTHRFFFNVMFFIFHSAGMAWLPPAKPCPWDMNETSNPKVSLELRGGFYAA